MLALLRNPHQLARFAADPALAEPAVEELLRYDGPPGAVTRVAAAPVTIHDRAIAPGDRVFAILHAANRDPRQFPEPDRLDPKRAANRRTEEHTAELQSLMRTSYAVLCLQKTP